jgi:hypothetical protein
LLPKRNRESEGLNGKGTELKEIEMKTKQLGKSDLFISPVPFGASAWEQALAAIHRGLELLARISQTAVAVVAIVLVAVIAWFDYVTGDFSLAVFYLVPVVLATWYAGRVSGWFIGVLSAAAWLVGDPALSHAYGHPAHALLECCDARVDLRDRRLPFVNAPQAPGRTSRACRAAHRFAGRGAPQGQE